MYRKSISATAMGAVVLCLMCCHSESVLIHVSSTSTSSLSCTENFNCALVYYASNVPRTNDTVLLLDEGIHTLHLNESILFSGLRNVSIIGSSRLVMGSSGLLEQTTKIQCTGTSGFVFSHSEDLFLSDLSIVNCGGALLNDSSTSAALTMKETVNVTLKNVVVKNSYQYGMIGFNMFGSSIIRNSIFVSNSALHVNQHGGNILLSWSTSESNFSHDKLYLQIDSTTISNGNGGGNGTGGLHIDYQLSCTTSLIAITNSTFQGNSGGNLAAVIHHTNQSCYGSFQLQLIKTSVLDGMGDRVTGAGGVSFVIIGNESDADMYSHLPEYYLYTKDSFFARNINNHSSGGVYINSRQMSFGKLSVEFFNCSFKYNIGLEGGAIAVHLADMIAKQHSLDSSTGGSMVLLSSCTFDGNFASKAGAIHVLFSTTTVPLQLATQPYYAFKNESSSSLITVSDCVLHNNVAVQSGSALTISNAIMNHHLLMFIMNNTVVQQNEVINSNQFPTFAMDTHMFISATTVLENTNTIISNSSFLNNTGSAIFATHSKVLLAKSNAFIGNSATNGGGIQLSRAKLLLLGGTKAIFESNHANGYGGAIYIYSENPPGSVHTQGCFVTRSASGIFPGELPQLIFVNNSASYGGSTVYGPEEIVTSCLLDTETASLFNFQDLKKLSVASLLDSESTEICQCYNNTPNCDEYISSKHIYPGGTLSLEITTLGYNGEMIPRIINAKLQQNKNASSSLLTGGLQMTRNTCTSLNYTLLSNSTKETIILTVVQYNIVHPLTYLVHLLPCPVGFSIQKNSPECDCIPQLSQLGVDCFIDDQTFEHNGNIWIGMNNDFVDPNNTDTSPHVLISSACPLGYCGIGHVRMALEDADKQCTSNRSGILCGGCQLGLSTSIGPSNCIGCESMTSVHTALFVFLFSAAGLVLIAFLRLCNLTISQGSLNPVMFYANVLHVNGTFFFKNRLSNPLTVFVSWFNLDFGFETCFYNGMDATGKAWLQFVFPLYLWVAIAIIYFASQHSTKFVRLMGRNSHSVILTLFHLSFFKAYRATVAVLLYTDLQNENGEHFRVWRYDGNVNYYSRKHTPLLALSSMVLILFIIPYSVIMVCTPLIVRKGYQVRCITFWRLKPFFDAYTGPYKDKAMFWNGLTTVIFTILLVTSKEADMILNLVLIALSSLSLVFLNFAFGGIYRKWTLSITEAAIHTNMTFLAVLSLLSVTRGHAVIAAAYTSTAVSFMVFIGVVIIHGIKELSRVSKTIHKIKLFLAAKWCHLMHNKPRHQQCHCKHAESENHQSGRDPYTLGYYNEVEESTGRYYETDHRDHLLTTEPAEDNNHNSVILPISINAPSKSLEGNQHQVLPQNHTAITFSVVALEDDEEDEDDVIEEEIVSGHDNKVTAGCSTIDQEASVDNDSGAEVSEVHINMDENVPLLSPFIVSPQNELNYSTFQQQESTLYDDWALSPLQDYKKFQKLSATNCPLDSDIDATGQRPSQVNMLDNKHLHHLQRLTDPIELALIDEGEGDHDEPVKPKIYQHNLKPNKIHSSSVTTKYSSHVLQCSDDDFSEFEADETIPLLPLKNSLTHTKGSDPELTASQETGAKGPKELVEGN